MNIIFILMVFWVLKHSELGRCVTRSEGDLNTMK